MSSHQVAVLVSPTGETRITTQGFQGPRCREVTKTLEAALGVRLSETLTAEYYLDATQQVSVTERPDGSR